VVEQGVEGEGGGQDRGASEALGDLHVDFPSAQVY
jgi:hypothetical protein